MSRSPSVGRRRQSGGGGEGDAPTSSGLPFGTPKQLSDGGLKTSLVQRVHEALMAALDAGELQPGSRIVASEVAQKLGLSRAPVREALAVLAGQGLVELHPDRGAILRPLSLRDLAGIFEVSAPVAAVGLKGAALRIHEADNAERVKAAMAAIRDAAREIAPKFEFYLVLNDFHYLINTIAERPYVDFLLRAINIEYWNRVLANAVDLSRHVDQYVANYQRITDAVLAGDGPSAESVMRFHAQWSISLLNSESVMRSPDRRRNGE